MNAISFIININIFFETININVIIMIVRAS